MSYIPEYEILNSVFFDLETVPKKEFSELDEKEIELWSSVANKIRSKSVLDSSKTDEELWPHAGLYAEFGKIVCASIGLYSKEKNTIYYRDYAYDDEIKLLTELNKVIKGLSTKSSYLQLAGFNIENFDMSFLLKRLIINQIEILPIFNNFGKKPWDIKFLDLAKVWMGTGFQDRYMIKLDVLCYCLGVKSPKTALWGGSVWEYYKNDRLNEIGEYCNLDIISTIECALVLAGINIDEIEKVKI